MITGDLSIVRDFVDVRDVVKAYYLLLLHGKKGAIYNICSGEGTSLGSIIDKMCEILEISIVKRTDPALIRPNDNKIIVGSSAFIRQEHGWSPTIPVEQSLRDIIHWWQLHA